MQDSLFARSIISGLWDGNSRSFRMLVVLLALVLNSSAVFALVTTPGSPCADVCGTTTNTTSSEIACLDQSYNQTTTGKSFKKCISCQLDSEFHDASTGESDVNWGLCMLWHLREFPFRAVLTAQIRQSALRFLNLCLWGPRLNLQHILSLSSHMR
jgi:hypothetical protein